MPNQRINRVSGLIAIALSVLALLTVISGYFQPPTPDEGTGAHIFQISIVLLVPTILVFLATADWQKPLRSLRPLALPVAALAFAFGALYYLEHYR
jgi:membrane protease YdiL (CAAX protease family)